MNGHESRRTALGLRSLQTRALMREAGNEKRLLAAGEWRPSAADSEAAASVLDRLAAPLPARRATTASMVATDRDRRLQRLLRTTLHHLDAGVVSPPAVALLAAVARAFLPWYATPNPPGAAAAPRYGAPGGTADGLAGPPTATGEALLPELTELFAALAATRGPGAASLTPPAEPWQLRYAGRFRRYGRPAAGVWTAETVACPACGGTAGPWTVMCDWLLISLGCPCGMTTHEHGLAFSEVWLLLPDM